ncbi:MAG: PilZ domain-containing protein, partial [Thermanaerothrix sp.]|nr:PilZ domain-containing protein [Thermanaerothrix sp.]
MVTEEIRQPGQREPLMALRALAIQQLPLTLAVPYKGMLLEQTLQPRVVGADGITFPPPKLMLCAAIYQIVYLHSRFLPATVRGYVQWLTTERCELHLSNLRFLATSWRPRSEQRVQPEEHLMVTVWVNRMPFQALLADLSVHGVGLLFDSWVETPPANLERGLRFEVTLPLARQYAITVTAELVHVRRYQEHLWQVGARLAPTLEQERWLEHHVSERRVKI